MHGRLLALALIAAASSATGAAAAPAYCNIETVAVLPVSIAGGRARLTLKINGEPAPFMADSGSFFSFMNQAAVDRFKLAVSSAPAGLSVHGVGGSDAHVSVATVRDFGIADEVLHNVQFLVARGLDSDVAGILGQNILAAFDTEYDLQNGVIRLMKPGADCVPRANLAYWSAGQGVGLMAIDRIERTSPHIRGTAKVNGRTVRVILDSGAPASILKRSTAEHLGFSPSGVGVRTIGVAHGIGPHAFQSWIAPFRSVDIGGEQILNTQLRVADIMIDGADMLLGMDFFMSHRIYISNRQHLVYFTYNGGPVFRHDRPRPR